MSPQTLYPQIVFAADGTAHLGTSRYKVLHLAAEHYQHGWTAEELLRQHPDLQPEQVYAALAYFYEHREAMISQMKAGSESIQATIKASNLSRNELMRRRASMSQ